MKMTLSKEIDRVENISREQFEQNYLKPQKPVIIKHFYGKGAALYSKWTFEYFEETIGQAIVGFYDDESTERKEDRSYKSTDNTMFFGEYLRLLQEGPTTKRLFLFNIFKLLPDLRKDFAYPELGTKYLKKFPFVFFGGKGAVTRIHHDMDMSNVFLTELTGKKRIILFAPKYNKHLYRYPMGVHSSVDPLNPDFERFPALKYAKGLDITLEKGETLFMPSGYWHHIVYEESSFGLAIRSWSPKWSQSMRGAINVGVLTHLDEILRYCLGGKWFQIKQNIAEKRANCIVTRSKGENSTETLTTENAQTCPSQR